MNLEIKPDVYSLNKIENLEKAKPSVKMRLGWLKEYSTLSKENHLYTMLGKQLQKSGHKYSLSTDLERYAQKKEEAPNMGKRKSMNQNIASSSIIMKLGGAAENIILENENFNIFEFEKKNR